MRYLFLVIPWVSLVTLMTHCIEGQHVGVGKDMHIYMIILPNYAVCKVVETIKKNTSRSLSREFTLLENVYWDQKGIW